MFNNIGPLGLVLIVVVVVLLFGRGKISGLMGDVAKGIKSFKRGMAEEVDDTAKAIDTAAEKAQDITPAKDKA